MKRPELSSHTPGAGADAWKAREGKRQTTHRLWPKKLDHIHYVERIVLSLADTPHEEWRSTIISMLPWRLVKAWCLFVSSCNLMATVFVSAPIAGKTLEFEAHHG